MKITIRQMGISKTGNFKPKQLETAALCKALGHPARVAIVEYLIKTDACICGDIVNELPLAQSTVSQHLKELKMAGWIKGEVEGHSVCYCIEERAVQKLQKYLAVLSDDLLKRKNHCC